MRSTSQCLNIVYLAGGFTHALNDVLHAAERERLGVPVFKLAICIPAGSSARTGVGVKLYAICFQRTPPLHGWDQFLCNSELLITLFAC
jgi:hypothetical protein